MYQATVCKLTDLQKHPNADNLYVGYALGYAVIVGKDNHNGQYGVVFPEGGKLTHNMLMANRLYRKDPLTGNPMGGYFEENGRVKAIKLRGAKSEAFWTPLSSLAWTGEDVSNLDVGDTFTHLNGEVICEKYYTPATLREMRNQKKAGKKGKRAEDYAPEFSRHFDTSQLRDAVYFIIGSSHAKAYLVTEKLHGTSGRTGNVLWTKKNWWQRILSNVGLYKDKYRLVSGTRKVVLDPDAMEVDTGYYAGTNFRSEIHKSLDGKLKPGEILYYEIVGYSQGNTPIMPAHGLNKKALAESGIPKKELDEYGNEMMYTYGCEPDEYEIYVYRIVQDGKDLPFHKMQYRCMELGLNIVPVLGAVLYKPGMTVDEFIQKVEVYTRGNSTLDSRHIREGVCLRLDDPEFIKPQIFKYKGFLFSALEGIRKNTDSYIDLEEVS